MWNTFRRRATSIFGIAKVTKSEAPPIKASKVDTILSGRSGGAKIPHHSPPSVEYEDALRNSGLRGVDAIRAAASNMMGRATSSLRSAANEAKTGIEQNVKENIQKSRRQSEEVASRVTRYAHDIQQSVGKNVDKSMQVASGRLASVASTVKDQAHRKSIDATTLVSTNASKIVDTASTAASHFTRRTVGNLATELREAGEKIIQSAWWWSLAAVGIYGFASALPGEVRRYLSDGDEPRRNK
jgi:hypothetical protein